MAGGDLLHDERPSASHSPGRRGARRSALTPGGVELLSVIAGTIAMAVIALAGIHDAADRPHDAGVAIAVADTSSKGTDRAITLVVTNGAGTRFSGTVVATAGDVEASKDVAVEPGEQATVRLSLPASCADPARVTLAGTPGGDETVGVPACPGGGS